MSEPHTNGGGISCMTHKYGWRDRVRAFFFPFVICHVPEAPAHYLDCIVTRSRTSLSFMDRLRIFCTGKVEVETRIVTEYTVGDTVTNTVLRAGKFSA